MLDDDGVRAELDAIRGEGVLIGLSVTGPQQPATIERALEVGGFDAVQATWNLHERSAEPALARAHDAGLRVYVKEALANGRLAPRGGNETLAAVAREVGTSEDAVALAAALARPWESNHEARALDWSDELEQRLAGLAEEPDAYWGTRAALPWN